jgi:predicted ATP-grasp superfamily ATP-dependent carboligase
MMRMFSPPKIFVHEFISGGGWSEGDLPPGLVREGYAILWALLSDFQAWGAARIVTTLDTRLWLRRGELPTDEISALAPAEYEAGFRSILSQCDAALIVAPETGGLLARLSAIVVEAGIPLLGCSPKASALAGDKAACDRIFRRAGLLTPPTRIIRPSSASQAAKELGYPLVVKPVDGVGCEGLSLVNGPEQLQPALEAAHKSSQRKEILLQSFVSGNHASVSLLASSKGLLPLSLNGQRIEAGQPFHYHGGVIPYSHPAARQALELALAAAGRLPGLRGYCGVDLVLGAEGGYIIEINPRITTSYIGLRRVLQANLAELIWNACILGELPEHVDLVGQVVFYKDDPIHVQVGEAWTSPIGG